MRRKEKQGPWHSPSLLRTFKESRLSLVKISLLAFGTERAITVNLYPQLTIISQHWKQRGCSLRAGGVLTPKSHCHHLPESHDLFQSQVIWRNVPGFLCSLHLVSSRNLYSDNVSYKCPIIAIIQQILIEHFCVVASPSHLWASTMEHTYTQ